MKTTQYKDNVSSVWQVYDEVMLLSFDTVLHWRIKDSLKIVVTKGFSFSSKIVIVEISLPQKMFLS